MGQLRCLEKMRDKMAKLGECLGLHQELASIRNWDKLSCLELRIKLSLVGNNSIVFNMLPTLAILWLLCLPMIDLLAGWKMLKILDTSDIPRVTCQFGGQIVKPRK